VIFLDSNVPMYLVGKPHQNKDAAARFLAAASEAGIPLVTDAEVFQEILHRYSAIRRPEAIAPAFEVLADLVDRVFPVELADVRLAARIVERALPLQARDALHLAIMERYGVSRILTFDRGFDAISGIERLAVSLE
jgi:uncharacterized protein